MIIGRSDVTLAATSWRQITRTRTDQGRIWVDDPDSTPTARQPANRQTSATTPRPPGMVRLPSHRTGSSATPAAAPQNTLGPATDGDDCPDAATVARFGVMIELVERLTGYKIRVLDSSTLTSHGSSTAEGPATPPTALSAEAARPTRQGWGIDITSTTTRTEAEGTAFCATGTVETTGGRKINFAIDLMMRRESVEVDQYRLRAGDALVDPLVLNLSGEPLTLAPSAIDFDLNADGRTERIAFVTGGSGLLTLDRNGNGKIDDGGELFGPRTGDGFAELAALDDDGNGWIDEADAAYSQLRLWESSEAELVPLADRGVGAIGLANVATRFTLAEQGTTTGMLQSTGVWLGEHATAGTIHHVDLAI